METLVLYATLFFAFSIFGYYYEVLLVVIFRGEHTTRIKGPYHPVYGIGVVAAFFIYTLDFNIWTKLAIIAAVIILIEYITGLFFNKLLGLNLWDYGKRPLNLHGQICLTHAIGWVLAAALLVFAVLPFLYQLTINVYIIILITSFLLIVARDITKQSIITVKT